MKISIIIPFKNSSTTLKKCIRSVQRQTFKNLEVILIENCADYESKKIAKEMSFKDKRIKIFSQKKLGVSNARNLGIKKASGEYIFFLDSDDIIEKRALKEIYNFNQKFKLDLAILNHKQLINKKKISKNKMIKKDIIFTNLKLEKYFLKSFLLHYEFLIFTHCWGKLFNRNLIYRYNIEFNKKMSQLEDTNFIFKYIYFAKKIGYLNKSLYLHNVKNSNSINRESYKVNQSIIFCLENLFIQITKYINKKNFRKKNILILNLKHMIASILIIFVLRIQKKDKLLNSKKFKNIVKSVKLSKIIKNSFNYYLPKDRENKWIPNLFC